MAAAAMKHMASNFAKLEKFKGADFRRWQKKMYFLISSMSVRATSVAINARQSKGKLHGVFLTTSFTPQGSFKQWLQRNSNRAYTRTDVQQFRVTLIQLMESVKKSIDEKAQHKQDGTKSEKQVTRSSSGNYITHVVDADIRPVNDQVTFAKVQLTAQHNVLANEQQHSVQSETIYDTHLLEKVDRNTTPDSTNMCHMGGEID
ncbi:hypothetical protein Tco_0098702 [Tanacetum coccineum]